MADLDALAPDQRAVLQLVLGQGRDFDQLAGLLKISPHAVRDRATAGTETLVPPPAGVNASERDAIVAYLLGAGSRPRDLSDDGRAWGDEVREALKPLARDELPELPGGAAAKPAPAPKPASRAAAPKPTPTPAAAAASDDDEESDDESISPRGLSRPAAERRSLLGGALLLVGIIAIVAVILVKVLGGNDDNKNPKPAAATTPPTANTSAAATQTAQGNATTTGAGGVKVRAQVNSLPRAAAETAGIAQLVTQNTSAGFAVTAQGLTTVPNTYTGVWLTGSGVDPS